MIDVYQAQQDLKDLLEAQAWLDQDSNALEPPAHFFIEAEETDFTFANMPLFNVRTEEADFEMTSLPNGYFVELSLLVDVVTFDLKSYRKAARLRDSLVKQVVNFVRANKNFNSEMLTSRIGSRLEISAGGGAGGHQAMTTITIVGEYDVEPN